MTNPAVDSPSGPLGGALRTYEIGFDGDVVDLVHRAVPTAQVLCRQTCTVLCHHVRDATELDVLLNSLMALGITSFEVFEAAGRARHGHGQELPRLQASAGEWAAALDAPMSTCCEVRVEGRLGDATLRHLRWSHKVVQTTVVRVRASQDALRAVLAELATAGRLDYLVAV
jgi:hypothetical protein